MKFEELSPFEKYIQEHSDRIFLIATPLDTERKKIMQRVTSLLAQKEQELHPITFESHVSLESFSEAAQNRPLFGATLIIIDGLDRVKKEVREEIAKAILSNDSFFLFGAAHLRGVSELPLKKIPTLDLSHEKPWQRERRLLETCVRHVEKAGKKLHPEAAAFLLEQVGGEQGLLEMELEKLLSFTGLRTEITLEDVKTLASPSSSFQGWEVSKRLVWGEEEVGFFLSMVLNLDPISLPQLIGQIRYFLQMGEQLAENVEKPAELFPHLNPSTLEKYHAQAKKIGRGLFQKRLIALNDLEIALKMSNVDPSILWDLFIGRWK